MDLLFVADKFSTRNSASRENRECTLHASQSAMINCKITRSLSLSLSQCVCNHRLSYRTVITYYNNCLPLINLKSSLDKFFGNSNAYNRNIELPFSHVYCILMTFTKAKAGLNTVSKTATFDVPNGSCTPNCDPRRIFKRLSNVCRWKREWLRRSLNQAAVISMN